MKKAVRMTDDEQSGFIEAQPASSKQVLRPSDAGLMSVDRMAEGIAREIGYSGAAYGMEVVHIQQGVRLSDKTRRAVLATGFPAWG